MYVYPEITSHIASNEQIDLNAPHAPTDKAIEAFEVVEKTIKSEILKSRHHWDKHEPKMWSRAEGVSDDDLVAFTIRDDLVEIRWITSRLKALSEKITKLAEALSQIGFIGI